MQANIKREDFSTINIKEEYHDTIEEHEDHQESCMVCTKEIVDPSHLDSCSHVICFRCMKAWLKQSMKCPTCRTAPREFIIINPGKENEESYPISEITKEKEAEARETAGNSVPLTNERTIIRKAKAECQLEMDKLNNPQNYARVNSYAMRPRSKRNDTKKKEFADISAKLNVFGMLLDYENRASLIENNYFRQLLYKYGCEWSSANRELHRRNGYSPRYVREHYQAEEARIIPFLIKELNNVEYNFPGAKQQNISMTSRRSRAQTQRRINADIIFNFMTQHNIHAPVFHNLLTRKLRLTNSSADRFQHELFNFAASGLEESEFYAISCYRLTDGANTNNFAVGGLNSRSNAHPEVVTIDDRDERDDDIIIEERPNIQPESIYIRDDPISSESDIDELYQRRGCLYPDRSSRNIVRNNPIFNQNSAITYHLPELQATNPFELITGFNHNLNLQSPINSISRFTASRPISSLGEPRPRAPEPIRLDDDEPVIVESGVGSSNIPGPSSKRAKANEYTPTSPSYAAPYEPTSPKIVIQRRDDSVPSSREDESSRLPAARSLEKEQDKAFRRRIKELKNAHDWHKRKMEKYKEAIEAEEKEYEKTSRKRRGS